MLPMRRLRRDIRRCVVIVRAAAILSVLMTACSLVRADTEASVRKQLQANYDTQAAAFRSRDVARLMSLAAPDVVVKLPNGNTMVRSHIERDAKTEMSRIKSVRTVSNRILRLEVHGNTAVVAAESHAVYTMVANKKEHVIDRTLRGRDTWVKTPHGWRLKMEDQVQAAILVDGHAMNNGG